MTDITHPEMVRKLFKDPTTIKLDAAQINLLHAAVGLAGEAGEVMGVILEDPKCVLPETRDKLIGELGDFEFYFEATRQAAGIATEVSTGPLAVNMAVHSCLARGSCLSVTACNVLDIVKKMVFNNRMGLRDDLVFEMCQLEIHLANIREAYRITREATLVHNIDKLGARYDGFKYSDEAAAARRDEK